MPKKTLEHLKKDMERLKKEKSALIEKNRSLAEIIEEITREHEEEKGKHESGKDTEEVSSIIKKEIESELSGLGDKLKDLEKISELAEKVKELSDQVKNASSGSKPKTVKVQGPLGETEVPAEEAQPAEAAPVNPFGGSTSGTQIAQNLLSQPGGRGPVGKALASFGEDVDFQTELIEIKNTITDLNKNLNNLQKKMEYRVSRLEEETKALDRINELEQGFEEISEKLSPENVQKLKRLIFSTDELVDEIIPDLINKRLRTRIDPILSDLGNTKNAMEVLNNRLVSIRNDIKELQKFENEVNELGMNLKLEKERVNKKVSEYEDKTLENVENLREEMRKKFEKVTDDISKIQTKSTQLIAEVVKQMFMDIVDPKISDIEKGNVVFDERLNKLFDSLEKVKRQMSQLQAPENLKEWIDDRGKEIEKKLQIDVVAVLKDKLSILDKLRKEVSRNDEELNTIRKELLNIKTLEETTARQGQELGDIKERTRKLEVDTRDIPKQLDYHLKQINKLSDTRDVFGRDIEKLFAEIKSLDGRTLKNEKDVSSIFSELKAMEKSVDSRFDGVSKNIISINDNINTLESFVNRLAMDTSKAEAELREDISDTRAGLSSLLQKKLDEAKKDLERVRDRDLRNQLKEFKGELKKISDLESGLKTFRDSQEDLNKKVVGDISKLYSIPGDIQFLREKLDALEGTNQLLEKRLSTDVPEAVNNMVNAKFQEATENLSSDISGVRAGLDAERERVNSLEKETRASLKLNESRFSDISKNMSALQRDISNQIKFSQSLAKDVASMESSLEGNINRIRSELAVDFDKTISSVKNDLESRIMGDAKKELEHLNSEIRRINALEQGLSSLEKSYASFSDGVRKELGALSTNPEEIQLLKKRIKDLEKIDSELDRKLNSLKAPENVKKWFDNKVEDFRKDLSREVKDLEDQLSRQSDNYTDLKDTVLTLSNLSRDIPAKLERQQSQINRILDFRESLSNREKALEASVKQLLEDLEADRERLSAVEKTVGSAHEARLDEIAENLASLKQEIASIQSFSSGLAKDLSSSITELRNGINSAEAKMAARFDKTITNLRSELASSRDKEFKTQMERFRKEMERVASLEKALDSLQQTNRDSSNRQEERLSVLEKLIPDVHYLRDRVNELEEENKKLAETVSRNQVQIVEAIDQKTRDRKQLEKKLQSQRSKMAELLKELRK